jgi:hypothetical protein
MTLTLSPAWLCSVTCIRFSIAQFKPSRNSRSIIDHMNKPYSTSLTPAGSTNLPTKPSLSNWHTAHIRFKHGCVSRGFRTRYQLFRRPGCHGLASPQATVAAGEQPPATSDSNVGIDGFDKTRFIAGNRREKKQDQIPVR